MFQLSPTQVITMNRGDSASFQIFINKGNILEDIPLQLTDSDTVYFGVMQPGFLFENAILRKCYSGTDVVDGILTIELKPQDTLNLLPGTYYYEIKLRTVVHQQEYVQTIVPKRLFFIID